jgi:thioredoxin
MTLTEFDAIVADQDRPTILDIWAPWCGPCKMIKPHFDALAEEYGDRARVVAVNADESPEIAERLKIFSIPTVIAYRGGQEVARRKGAQNESDLRALFEAVATGQDVPAMSNRTRFIRIAAAALAAGLAGRVEPSWPLQAGAAFLFMSAIHDRCPIMQALKHPFTRTTS